MFVMKFEAGFEKQQQQQKTADKSFYFLLKKKEEKIDVISSASLSVICMELEIHRGQMFVDVKKIPNMMFIILILQQRSKWNAKKRKKKHYTISPFLLGPAGKQLFIWRRIKQTAMAGFQ